MISKAYVIKILYKTWKEHVNWYTSIEGGKIQHVTPLDEKL